MGLYRITNKFSMADVGKECAHSEVCLLAHPAASFLAPPFQAFYITWGGVRTQEDGLVRDEEGARATARTADVGLDKFIAKLGKQVLIATDGKKKHPLYQLFFGKRPPGSFGRIGLSTKIELCKSWIKPLKVSGDATLVTAGATLETLIQGGQLAEEGVANAVMALTSFRTIGVRKVLYDDFNVLRKDTFTKLDQMPLQHPELNLPLDFGDGFFKHRAPALEVEEPTTEDLQTELATIEAEATKLKQKIAAKDADDKAAAKKQKEAEEAQKEIDAQEKAAADAQAKIDELKAEFAKKFGP